MDGDREESQEEFSARETAALLMIATFIGGIILTLIFIGWG